MLGGVGAYEQVSRSGRLTAATDTMRAQSADSLAEAMLRQTNNQQTSYETIRFQVQRTAGQLHQSDFERRADAELLLEQLRQAGVQDDVYAAAEQLRRIARARRH
jgi:hypothetical protein